MKNNYILERVINFFSTMTEAEEITADSDLIDDLEVSSMDILFLVSGMEEESGIKIPEKELRKASSVGDVADIIERLVK